MEENCAENKNSNRTKNYRKNKYRSTTCFVPGCKSTSRSGGSKRTLFSAPKDEELRRKWSESIARKGKVLDANRVVCEDHFEDKFIERHFSFIINGELVQEPRERPRLVVGAIPTLVLNHATNFEYKSLQQDKNNSTGEIQISSVFCNASQETEQEESILPSEYLDIPSEYLIEVPIKVPFVDLNCLNSEILPSKNWSYIRPTNNTDMVVFATWDSVLIDNDSSNYSTFRQPSKALFIKKNKDPSADVTVWINGKVFKRYGMIEEISEVRTILNEVNAMQACKGSGLAKEFPDIAVGTKIEVRGEGFYHKSCKLVTTGRKDVCLFCKMGRCLLRKKLAWNKKKPKTKCWKDKYRAERRHSRLLEAKLKRLQEMFWVSKHR